MRSVALLSLLALASAAASAAAAADPADRRGGWGPDGWSGGQAVTAGPTGAAMVGGDGYVRDRRGGVDWAGPHGRDGYHRDGAEGPHGRFDGPPHGVGMDGPRAHGKKGRWMGPGRPGGPDSYYYVEGDQDSLGYYYVPGQGYRYAHPHGYAQPHGYRHRSAPMTYVNPHGPIMVAPGTTVIVKVAPSTITKTVTEELVYSKPRYRKAAPRSRSKLKCRC